MEHLTEHIGAEFVYIKDCKTLYSNQERKDASVANAIVRLAAYEDAMPLDRAQELARAEKDGLLAVLEPNDPLTLEQLLQMDGEPVWVEDDKWLRKGGWGLVSAWTGPTGGKCAVYVYNTKTGPTLYPCQEYGRCWRAYRRKPESKKTT